jgi:ketosteroid isomerase-like protein
VDTLQVILVQLFETNKIILQRFTEAWAAGNIPQTMRYIARECVYALHVSDEALPFAGETQGADAIEATLRHIREKFDYLLYRPINIREAGDQVRLQVEFMYRHRASGEPLSGLFRLVLQFRDGLIVRGDEYHDRARIEAFMRLIASEA